MDVEVVRFVDQHLPAVRDFSESTWSRPRTDAYYHWRYQACRRFHRQFLALRGSEILAMVSAFAKPYLLGGARGTCLEVFDWYCRPGLKGEGIGGKLLHALMDEPEPLLIHGGTVDTLARLPHMQWEKIGGAQSFDLPVDRHLMADAVSRRLHLELPATLGRAVAGALRWGWYHTMQFARPSGVETFFAASPGEEILTLYDGVSDSCLLQLPDLEYLRWLTGGYSGLGHFLPLYFHDQERLRGWSLARIQREQHGITGTLVDLFWPRGDATTYSWMVAQTILCLLSFQPQRIVTTATSPVLQSALRQNRFRDTGPVPIHYYGKGHRLGGGPIELTHNYADAPLLPYPAVDSGTGFLVKTQPA